MHLTQEITGSPSLKEERQEMKMLCIFFNLSERLPGYNSMLEKPQSICDSLESQELWHKYRHCFCGLIVRHQQKHTIRG